VEEEEVDVAQFYMDLMGLGIAVGTGHLAIDWCWFLH
jgi:hypothetical protein